MSKPENDAPRNRTEILEEEIGIHKGLEQRFVGRAATAAADGDMDAFRWAMDTSRKAGDDAAALSAIVRAESSARLRDLAMKFMADRVPPSFSGETYDEPGDKYPRVPLADVLGPLTTTRFDESALEPLRQAMAGSDPIMILGTHYGGPARRFESGTYPGDVMDGMIAHRPDVFFPREA